MTSVLQDVMWSHVVDGWSQTAETSHAFGAKTTM